jgi:hypothetical protein
MAPVQNSGKTTVVNAIKIYIFPSLVTILAMMIWRDVTELRTDVKALLAQSNVDKTKIENLEKDVRMLEQSVFNKRITAGNMGASRVLSYDRLFKHEELYDIKKHLNTYTHED